MHRVILVILLALTGCAIPPPSDVAAPPTSAGRTALSIIGTPFLIAFKIPVCVVSAALAGPLAGVAQLSDTYQRTRLDYDLGDGLERNCGPPYVVTP
jgi:hypothetical protein